MGNLQPFLLPRFILLLILMMGLAAGIGMVLSEPMPEEDQAGWLVLIEMADEKYQPGVRGYSLCRAIRGMQSRRILFYTQGELTTLPPQIGQMTNLRELYLLQAGLTSLPPEIGQLEHLEILGLSLNDIAVLPPEIGRLRNLKLLYMAFNELTSLPTEMGQLSKLEVLDLRGNEIDSLPVEMLSLSDLRELDLHNNPIEIPDSILDSDAQAILAYLREQDAGDD